MPEDVEGAFEWDRRGAPQVRHTHGFPALIRVILRDRFPDVLAALLEAGVGELSILPPSVSPDSPGYEQDAADLQVLCCRRTTLEWVFRRCALAEPALRFQVGVGATGLLVDGGGDGSPLDVRGVRLEDGTELRADVVVASTGRRGDVPAWFKAHGVEIPEEEHPTGTVYLSRFYRSAAGAEVPMGYQGGRRAGLGFVVAGADNGTYSATLAVDADDAELRAHLLDADRFEAVLPLFREMEPVVTSGGTPITPVQVMGGLINRIRRFVDPDGTPKAHGFFAIGDAHTCTNPLYGRGSSLAVLQAVLVADALVAHPVDRDEAARAYEEASAARVEPWFDVSVLTDLAAQAPVPAAEPPTPPEPLPLQPASEEPATTEADVPPEPAPPRLDLATLRRIAASGDPVLAVMVVKTMSLLLTPQEVFGDPDVVRRLADAAATEVPRDPDKPVPVLITRELILATGVEAEDPPVDDTAETVVDVEAVPAPAVPRAFPSAFVAGVLVLALLAVVIGVTVLRDDTDGGGVEVPPPTSMQGGVEVVPIEPAELVGQVDTVGGAVPVAAAMNEVRLSVSEAGVTGELHLQIDRTPDLADPSTTGCFSVDVDLDAKPLAIARDAHGAPVAAGPAEVILGYVDQPCAAGAPRDSEGRPATVVITLEEGRAVGTVSFEDADGAMSFSAASAAT
jgi:2-polyprenyl-6-methoxyphenol hydroxylase-like FAD-dependent oxidoreductase